MFPGQRLRQLGLSIALGLVALEGVALALEIEYGPGSLGLATVARLQWWRRGPNQPFNDVTLLDTSSGERVLNSSKFTGGHFLTAHSVSFNGVTARPAGSAGLGAAATVVTKNSGGSAFFLQSYGMNSEYLPDEFTMMGLATTTIAARGFDMSMTTSERAQLRIVYAVRGTGPYETTPGFSARIFNSPVDMNSQGEIISNGNFGSGREFTLSVRAPNSNRSLAASINDPSLAQYESAHMAVYWGFGEVAGSTLASAVDFVNYEVEAEESEEQLQLAGVKLLAPVVGGGFGNVSSIYGTHKYSDNLLPFETTVTMASDLDVSLLAAREPLTYSVTGTNFQSVTIPTETPSGDDEFEILFAGNSYLIGVNEEFDFTLIDPLGATEFAIAGIDAAEEIDWNIAFKFTTPGVAIVSTNLLFEPLADPVALPEPSSIWSAALVTIVFLGLAWRTRPNRTSGNSNGRV